MRTLPPGKDSGFSLLELLVVLFLLGAAAGIVVPSFIGGMSSVELETATRDLITRMRQARTAAVSTQEVHRIILEGPQEPEGPFHYYLTDEYEQPLQEFPLPEGIVFTGEEDLPRMVSFYPNGRSSGGSVSLQNSAGKTLRIEVDPVTGFGKLDRDREEF